MTNLYSCKVGTIPSLIHLRYNYKIEVGKNITFRFEGEREWRRGKIWRVNDNGYFFVNRI